MKTFLISNLKDIFLVVYIINNKNLYNYQQSILCSDKDDFFTLKQTGIR